MTQTFVGVLQILTCANCGMPFGIEADLYRRLTENGGPFFCPRGHSQRFSETEVQRLKQEIENRNRRIDGLHSTITDKNEKINRLNYSNRALKSAKTKILNRVKNGVCPCCNRTFKNLQEHFKTVHPEILKAHE